MGGSRSPEHKCSWALSSPPTRPTRVRAGIMRSRVAPGIRAQVHPGSEGVHAMCLHEAKPVRAHRAYARFHAGVWLICMRFVRA